MISALPESFAAWKLAGRDEVTAATTAVLGDLIVTMTLAFVPLALADTPIREFRIYWISLAAPALASAADGGLVRASSRSARLSGRWARCSARARRGSWG